MVGHTWSDPRTLDKALRGPNAKEWQEELDYEIGQLQKLGTVEPGLWNPYLLDRQPYHAAGDC